jgi:hypothetical protein
MPDINLIHSGMQLDDAIAKVLAGYVDPASLINNLVITAVDGNKRITAVDASSFTEIFPWQFWNYNGGSGPYVYLVNIILSNNLTLIGTYAFRFCYNLAITSLPNGVTKIGAYAFHGCANILLTSLPSSLITIEQNAFNVCIALRKIWIPISCTTIIATGESYSPFYNCSSSLVIYCEAASKPEGWSPWWNYYGAGLQLTVNWGVTKAQFDALP